MVSVICPIYNEEKILSENSFLFQKLSSRSELIFVDGGSIDKSREIARQFGVVLEAGKGRAVQMNSGAVSANNEILLFLHADTTVSKDALAAIEAGIIENGYAGGCLTQRIDKKGLIFRLIELQGNIRARLTKEFYGDQGIFVKKSVFLKIGGFPEVPIMEDVLFTRRLRDFGKTVVLPDKIFVSARRWESRGVIRTFLLYIWIILLFRFRYPLDKLKRLYDDLR